MAFDAFLSYSHAGEQRLAAELERALQGFAKPWYKRRALDIFRDQGNLNLSGHLWKGIQEALDASRFFVYLASPLAAQSPWISREIAYWKAHRDTQRLIILLTDGDLRWDAAIGDFDGPSSTAIPLALHDTFDDEPFYMDLRWAREAPDLSLRNERFKAQVAQLVATIKEIAVEDIVGEEAEQHRRTLRTRNSAIVVLAVLTVAAIAAAGVAVVQRSSAVRSAAAAQTSAREAEARRIDAEKARSEATVSAQLAEDRALEATRQQTIAQQQERAARIALAQASTQEAERLMALEKPAEALAHLARALRADPDSLSARSWISDIALNQRLWMGRAPFPHDGQVYTALFSSDGSRVMTAADDGTARVWDATTGRLVGAVRGLHARVDAMFSSDGRWVVTPSGQRDIRISSAVTTRSRITPLQQAAVLKEIFGVEASHGTEDTHLWSMTSGRSIGAPLEHDEPGSVDIAAFSRDSERVITASGNTARLWESGTAKPLGPPLRHQGRVIWTAFDSSGRIVTASDDNVVRVWDTASWQPIVMFQTSGNPAALSSTGLLAVVSRIGSENHTVTVWNMTTGARSGEPVQHEAIILSVNFSRDGRTMVTASSDDTARLWNAGTGRTLRAVLRHGGAVHLAAFSPDGRFVATASDDGTARIWDAISGRPVGAPLEHQGPVYGAVFSPDGRRVVTASFDGTARVWDYLGAGGDSQRQGDRTIASAVALSPDWDRAVTVSARGARVVELATGRSIEIESTRAGRRPAFSRDGRWILGQDSAEDRIRVWDAATGRPVGPPVEHEPSGGVFPGPALMSPDGRLVVTTSATNAAYIREVATGHPITPAMQHTGPITAVAFSPDGRRVITASADSTARLWDVKTRRPLARSLRHAYPVRAAEFSPDGRLVVTASNDTTARLWKADTGDPFGNALRHDQVVSIARFSPDGRRLLTVALTVASVWDVTTGQPVGARLQHPDAITTAIFSPDGQRIATGSQDGTARIWEAATGRPLGERLHHDTPVDTVDFSPDGTLIVTNRGDDDARIWSVLLDLRSSARLALAADLAEVLGGYRVAELGSVAPLDALERLRRMRRLGGPSATTFSPVEVLFTNFVRRDAAR